jgi:hypothetical protein
LPPLRLASPEDRRDGGVLAILSYHDGIGKMVSLALAVGIVRCAGCKTKDWVGIQQPVAAERRVPIQLTGKAAECGVMYRRE